MIRYSHHGMVVNGKLPPIFYLLYLLMGVVFFSLFLVFLLIGLVKDESQIYENMLETFKGVYKGLDSDVQSSAQYLLSLMCIFLILILIMCLGIFYSLRRTNNRNNRRQNVFTLNSTLFWGFLHVVLFASLILTLMKEQIHIFIVIRFIFISSDFIKTVVTIIENQHNLPELFSDVDTNNRPSNFPLANIHPRQENNMPFIPFRQDARYCLKVN